MITLNYQDPIAAIGATEEAFAALWRELGADGHSEWQFDKLKGLYAVRPRAYHTLEHVGWGLRRVSELAAAEGLDRQSQLQVCWAMWFHDAQMDFSGHGAYDEGRSAELSSDAARAAGLDDLFRMKAYRLILATAHLVQPTQLDEAIVVDADLSMLGASEPAFDQYERLVRREWAHVDDEAFRAGRLAVLQRFVDKPSIFTTPTAKARWEDQARRNLARSMERLHAGATPK